MTSNRKTLAAIACLLAALAFGTLFLNGVTFSKDISMGITADELSEGIEDTRKSIAHELDDIPSASQAESLPIYDINGDRVSASTARALMDQARKLLTWADKKLGAISGPLTHMVKTNGLSLAQVRVLVAQIYDLDRTGTGYLRTFASSLGANLSAWSFLDLALLGQGGSFMNVSSLGYYAHMTPEQAIEQASRYNPEIAEVVGTVHKGISTLNTAHVLMSILAILTLLALAFALLGVVRPSRVQGLPMALVMFVWLIGALVAVGKINGLAAKYGASVEKPMAVTAWPFIGAVLGIVSALVGWIGATAPSASASSGATGYAGTSNYGSAANYGAAAGFGSTANYGGAPNYGGSPTYGSASNYGSTPSGGASNYVSASNYGGASNYGSTSSDGASNYGGTATYGGASGYGTTPDYGSTSSYGSTPTDQSGFGGSPNATRVSGHSTAPNYYRVSGHDSAPASAPSPSAASGWTCPACGNPVRADANFCGTCGTARPTPKTCPTCGREVSEKSLFCPGCGTKL